MKPRVEKDINFYEKSADLEEALRIYRSQDNILIESIE